VCGGPRRHSSSVTAWAARSRSRRAGDTRSLRGLVLILGTAGKALETFYDSDRSPAFFRLAHRFVFAFGNASNEIVRPLLESPLAWFVARRMKLVDPFYAPREDMLAYMHHLATLDLPMFIETVVRTNDHDAWDLLPRSIDRCSSSPRRTTSSRRSTSPRRIQERVPGADLLVLADASHAALIEQPDTINRRVARFLEERLPDWSIDAAGAGRNAAGHKGPSMPSAVRTIEIDAAPSVVMGRDHGFRLLPVVPPGNEGGAGRPPRRSRVGGRILARAHPRPPLHPAPRAVLAARDQLVARRRRVPGERRALGPRAAEQRRAHVRDLHDRDPGRDASPRQHRARARRSRASQHPRALQGRSGASRPTS
jgi:hypothetical protein